MDVRSALNVPAPSADTNASTKKYVDDNAGGGGGGTQTVWPVRWYDQVDDDSTPPSGIPDLTADGVTLIAGDHVGGLHGVWEIASGTWTSVHTWVAGDLMLVTSDSWSDPDNPQYAAAFIIGDSGSVSPLLTGVLDELLDVTIPAAVTNAIGTLSIDALADVTTDSAAAGSVMVFDGTSWLPGPTPIAGSVMFFDGTNWNVPGGSPSSGDTIRWNDITSNYDFGP